MNALAFVWFAAAISGAVAALIGRFVPRVRQPALIVAGVAFSVAGVLGLFTIGILFIGLAVFCFSRLSSGAPDQDSPRPPPWLPPAD